MIRVRHLAAVAVLAGCAHERPLSPGSDYTALPPSGDPPRRLTYNADSEWYPVHTRDGSGILYSFAVPGRADRDRCLGVIPAAGGTMLRELCWRGGAEADSVDTVVLGADGPSGQLAFVVERGGRNNLAPSHRELLVTLPGHPDSARVVRSFPDAGVDPFPWFGARDLTWIDDSTLVFVALTYVYTAGGAGVPTDTTVTGIEVVRIDLRTDAAYAYPATRFASSVSAGPSPGTVIFTRGGDARVHTLNLATGAAAVLYDFGSLGMARDARLVKLQLVAVVGGFVTYGTEPGFAHDVQRDRGGPIYSVDLLAGTEPVLRTPLISAFRNVTVAPDGRAAVAERFPVAITDVGNISDLYWIPLP